MLFLPYPISFSFAYRYPSVGQYQSPAPNLVQDFLAILDVVIHLLLWAFAIGCDVALYNREVDLVNVYAATHTTAPDPSLTIVGSLSLFALSLTLLSVVTFFGGLLVFACTDYEKEYLKVDEKHAIVRVARDVPGFGGAFILGGLRVSSLCTQALVVVVLSNPVLFSPYHSFALLGLDNPVYQMLFAVASKEFLVWLLTTNVTQARWLALLQDKLLNHYALCYYSQKDCVEDDANRLNSVRRVHNSTPARGYGSNRDW